MSPKLRADAERNRRRLLDAAGELFSTRGLDVTLDDIAEHAGVGTGTAYRRFPNKDALIEELMVDRIGRLVAIAEECLADPDPWSGFRGYFDRALALQAGDRALKEILFSSARGKEKVMQMRFKLQPIVEQLVRRAVEAGVLRPEVDTSDVPVINMMLSGVSDFAGTVEPELYRRYLTFVLDGLRADGAEHEAPPVPALPMARFAEAMAAYRR